MSRPEQEVPRQEARPFTEAWWWCLYDVKLAEYPHKFDDDVTRLMRWNERYRRLRLYVLRRALGARRNAGVDA